MNSPPTLEELLVWAKSECDEAPATWILCTYGQPEQVMQAANVIHYPDTWYPTHVVIWSEEMVTVVPYHSIEYIYKQKP